MLVDSTRAFPPRPLRGSPSPARFPCLSQVSLRMQVMEASENGGVVGGRSLERCFAEYVVCNMVLFLVVMNFMG